MAYISYGKVQTSGADSSGSLPESGPASGKIKSPLVLHSRRTTAKPKPAKNWLQKNMDGIALNTPATLGAESGLFTWIDKQGLENWGSLNKAECAKKSE